MIYFSHAEARQGEQEHSAVAHVAPITALASHVLVFGEPRCNQRRGLPLLGSAHSPARHGLARLCRGAPVARRLGAEQGNVHGRSTRRRLFERSSRGQFEYAQSHAQQRDDGLGSARARLSMTAAWRFLIFLFWFLRCSTQVIVAVRKPRSFA